MPKLRVHNFSVSIDGYAAGPSQSLDEPLGVGGEQLHNWFFGTRTFHPTVVLTHHPRESITMEGGTRGGVPDGRRAGRPARGRRLNHPAISARRSGR
jgi:hypothetical protein